MIWMFIAAMLIEQKKEKIIIIHDYYWDINFFVTLTKNNSTANVSPEENALKPL